MIVVKLQGGIGNQLFQFAFGYAMAKRLGTQLKVDRSGYPDHKGRVYSLGWLREPPMIAAPSDVISTFPRVVEKPELRFDPAIIEGARKGAMYTGYWQSEAWFKDYEDDIRRQLTYIHSSPTMRVCRAMIQECDGVPISVHVRRGDLAADEGKYQPCYGREYFEDAAKRMLGWYPEARFFVFSDDPQWCMENLPVTWKVLQVPRPEEAIHLMSLCHHHIIVNSTFSWWGAWLNAHQNKTVIAPKVWFNDDFHAKSGDICPVGWILT